MKEKHVIQLANAAVSVPGSVKEEARLNFYGIYRPKNA